MTTKIYITVKFIPHDERQFEKACTTILNKFNVALDGYHTELNASIRRVDQDLYHDIEIEFGPEVNIIGIKKFFDYFFCFIVDSLNRKNIEIESNNESLNPYITYKMSTSTSHDIRLIKLVLSEYDQRINQLESHINALHEYLGENGLKDFKDTVGEIFDILDENNLADKEKSMSKIFKEKPTTH